MDTKQDILTQISDIDNTIGELEKRRRQLLKDLVDKFCPHKIGQKLIRTKTDRKCVGGTFFDRKYEDVVSTENLVCVGITYKGWKSDEYLYQFKRIKSDGTLTTNYVHGANCDKLEWLDEYYEGPDL